MLTDTAIKAIKPTSKDQWICDGNGLYLRVRKTGGKSWVIRRKRQGHTRIITLGKYPKLRLKAARLKAAELGSENTWSKLTLGALLDEWFEDQISPRYKRPRQIRLYLNRVSPELKGMKIRDITRADTRIFLKQYSNERGPVGANRLLAILKQAFKYAVEAGYIAASPIAGLSRRLVGGEEKPRDRVLTDDEIRLLWCTNAQHTSLLRFLLLTGQRIGETQLATWEDIDGERWLIPAQNTKNAREHWVALPRQAQELLKGLDRDRRTIFGRATTTGVQAWLRRWADREEITPRFTPHDLRRTFATRLNELGVAPHVVERILNHTLQGVMKVYNQAEYADERAEAMQLWADELDRIRSSKSL